MLVLCGFIRNRENFVRLAPELNQDVITENDLQAVYANMLELGEQFTVPELAEKVQGYGGLALLRDIRNCHVRYGVSKEFSFKETLRYAKAVEKLGRLHQLKTLFRAAYQTLEDKEAKNALLKLNDEQFMASVIRDVVDHQYNRKSSRGFKHYNTFLDEYTQRLQRILKGGPPEDRLMTGFDQFDRATGGGLPYPGFTILAAPPAAGKTQFALQVAVRVAMRLRDNHLPGVVAINSGEMLGVDLVSRAILAEAEINSVLLRTGGYKNDKTSIRRVVKALREHRNLPIFIDDSDLLVASTISSRASGLKAQYGSVVLLVTDFLELVSSGGGDDENPERQVAKAMITHKALSKRLSCAVIGIAHIGRQVELSGTRVPSVRQIRYSGMAEQIADLIDLLYLPMEYVNNGIKITPHPNMPPKEGIGYHILGKHRNGPTGFFALPWQSAYAKWG